VNLSTLGGTEKGELSTEGVEACAWRRGGRTVVASKIEELTDIEVRTTSSVTCSAAAADAHDVSGDARRGGAYDASPRASSGIPVVRDNTVVLSPSHR